MRQPAARKRAYSCGERTSEVVPGKDFSTQFIRQELTQPRLLHREKRTDFVAARADDADDGGDHQNDDVIRHQKDDARAKHEQCADDERTFAPEPVRVGGEVERDERVACKGECEEQTRLLFGQPGLGEIQDEDNREKSVTEHADDAGGKEKRDVEGGGHEISFPRNYMPVLLKTSIQLGRFQFFNSLLINIDKDYFYRDSWEMAL